MPLVERSRLVVARWQPSDRVRTEGMGVTACLAPWTMPGMDLRPELCPPAVEPGRMAELLAAIEAIGAGVERGEPVDAAIAVFNTMTGREYAVDRFRACRGRRDLQDFAVEAARPAWPKIADVTRDELIEIVRRILAGGDDDVDYYVLLLEVNVHHPGVIDLIFWPPPELADASPEEIIDAALSYRPIALSWTVRRSCYTDVPLTALGR
jgi:hypothetical protein